MKGFFKWVLAVLLGLFIWGVIKAVMFLFAVAGMAAAGSSDSAVSLPKEGVLLLDMSKLALAEQTKESSPFSASLGQGQALETVGILDASRAIRKAAEDPRVKYILIKADGITGGVTYLEEIRKALSAFRQSGKAVVAYGESFNSASYYLASVADKIYVTAHGGANHFFSGIGGRLFFISDLLDKLGVKMQLIRHGKYKSAGEMYTRNSPSPENLEQNQVMISSLWNTIVSGTASARGLSVDSLNYFADNLSISLPEDLLRHKLADAAYTTGELQGQLALLAGEEEYEDVSFFSLYDYADAQSPKKKKGLKDKIAIIYADGNIVEQPDDKNISGARFAKIIADVRADSSVKAVVFRVNSPGGTVLASQKIKTEIDLTRAVKPVIASYGNYAASGGYWISNSCDRIFTNASTLTGSIGVFATIPDFSGTMKDVLHINNVSLRSNKHSDMLFMSRALDEEETAWMQAYVDNTYNSFVDIVAQGRNLPRERVDSLAQGRVWTGEDALGIGLADEIGTLEDALGFAAERAGDGDISNWKIVSYPKPLTPLEELLSQLGARPSGEDVSLAVFKGTPLERSAKALWDWKKTWAEQGDKGQLLFARLPWELELR